MDKKLTMMKLDFLDKSWTETNDYEEEEIKNVKYQLEGNTFQIAPKINVII